MRTEDEIELASEISSSEFEKALIILKNKNINVKVQLKRDNYQYYYLTMKSLYIAKYGDPDRNLALEIIKILLEKGASPDVLEHEYYAYPLYNSLFYRNYDAFELLLKHGANTQIWSKVLGSILHAFARRPTTPNLLIKILTEYKCQKYINKLDSFGMAPIHYLAETDQIDLMKVLIDYGANTYLETKKVDYFGGIKKWTPIEIANLYNHEEMKKIIEQYPKEKQAMQIFADLEKVETALIKENRLSPSKQLPFDVAMKISTINMSPTQRYSFERKMHKKLLNNSQNIVL